MAQQHTPRLRFPGFEGEWERKTIQSISKKVNSGKTPLGGETVYTDNGIYFIRSQNVNDDRLDFDNITYIPEKVNSEMRNSVVKPNDILLNITGASLGRSCVVPSNFSVGNVNQHVCIIRIDEENSPRFIQPFFSSIKGQNIFKKLQVGGGREGLNFESIKSIKIFTPSLPEQQKIATFLSAVDERVRILTQQKTALERYKQGVMQQVFARQIRFKQEDGSDFPEWEEKRLGDLGEFIGGGTPESSNQEYWNGNIPWISSSDLAENSINKISITRYISEEALTKSATKLVPKGSVLMISRVGVGKFAVAEVELCTSQDFTNLVTNQNSYFLAYLFSYQSDRFKKLSQGTSILGFTIQDIKNTKFRIPTIQEQQKIASFLSSIDAQLAQVNQQLEGVKRYKKGLLQQLFV